MLESDQFFEEYRKKISDLKDLSETISNLQSKINSLNIDHRNLHNEISSMKRIITKMIDTGMSATEIKLKYNLDDLTDSMWDHDNANSSFGIPLSQGIVTYAHVNGVHNPVPTSQTSLQSNLGVLPYNTNNLSTTV